MRVAAVGLDTDITIWRCTDASSCIAEYHGNENMNYIQGLNDSNWIHADMSCWKYWNDMIAYLYDINSRRAGKIDYCIELY